MRVSIVGLGLIGGSIAIDLSKGGFASQITGVDLNKLHANTALNLGIVDQIEELDSAITKSELIILAIPANETVKLLPKIHMLITSPYVVR